MYKLYNTMNVIYEYRSRKFIYTRYERQFFEFGKFHCLLQKAFGKLCLNDKVAIRFSDFWKSTCYHYPTYKSIDVTRIIPKSTVNKLSAK